MLHCVLHPSVTNPSFPPPPSLLPSPQFKAFVFESLSTLSPLHAPPLASPTHHSLHQPHDLIASPRTIYTLQLSVGSIRGLDPACLPGSPFFCTLKVHACGVEVWEWKARRLAGKDAVFERVGETELALSKEDIERGEIEVVLGKEGKYGDYGKVAKFAIPIKEIGRLEGDSKCKCVVCVGTFMKYMSMAFLNLVM